MTSNITYPPNCCLFSRQLNLSDFGLEKKFKSSTQKILKENNKHITTNNLLKFIEYTYKYAKITLNKYSNYFSNHLYTQPILFTILAIKIYTQSTYREITDLLELSDKIKKYFKIKRIPHFTTIQKFFKKISSTKLKEINKLILITT